MNVPIVIANVRSDQTRHSWGCSGSGAFLPGPMEDAKRLILDEVARGLGP